jgi:hypothetical protein
VRSEIVKSYFVQKIIRRRFEVDFPLSDDSADSTKDGSGLPSNTDDDNQSELLNRITSNDLARTGCLTIRTLVDYY